MTTRVGLSSRNTLKGCLALTPTPTAGAPAAVAPPARRPHVLELEEDAVPADLLRVGADPHVDEGGGAGHGRKRGEEGKRGELGGVSCEAGPAPDPPAARTSLNSKTMRSQPPCSGWAPPRTSTRVAAPDTRSGFDLISTGSVPPVPWDRKS